MAWVRVALLLPCVLLRWVLSQSSENRPQAQWLRGWRWWPPSPMTRVWLPALTWWKERTDVWKLFSDLHVYMHIWTRMRTHTRQTTYFLSPTVSALVISQCYHPNHETYMNMQVPQTSSLSSYYSKLLDCYQLNMPILSEEFVWLYSSPNKRLYPKALTVCPFCVYYQSHCTFSFFLFLSSFQDICKSLWCHRVGHRCETKFMPAAEGTVCGLSMVTALVSL